MLQEHPYRTQLANEHYAEQIVLLDGTAISFPRTQVHLLQDSSLAAGDATIFIKHDSAREDGHSERAKFTHLSLFPVHPKGKGLHKGKLQYPLIISSHGILLHMTALSDATPI